MAKTRQIKVSETPIQIVSVQDEDYISLTDFNYGEFAIIKSQEGLNRYFY